VDVWELGWIIKYMDDYGMRVTIQDGKPTIAKGSASESQLARLMPHLKVRRADVIAHYDGSNPYRTFHQRVADCRAYRTREANLLLEGASRAGSRVYYLPTEGDKRGLVTPYKDTLPDEAGYIGLYPNGCWVKLPPVPKHREEYNHAPTKARANLPETGEPDQDADG
jgi:hypothetical protein